MEVLGSLVNYLMRKSLRSFCEYLGISKRTAQNYRDTGVIPFSQIGSKIYYRWSDVVTMIETKNLVNDSILQLNDAIKILTTSKNLQL